MRLPPTASATSASSSSPERAEIVRQAARCMDCGIPYCHTGCPVNNQIPDWNDLVYQRTGQAPRRISIRPTTSRGHGTDLPRALRGSLHAQYHDVPVTIKTIECAIADKAFDEGWVEPSRRMKPASGWPSSARAPPALPPPSSSPAPAMTCMSSRGTPIPAACCATAFPISRWKNRSSTAAWSRWRRKASPFTQRRCRRRPARQTARPRLRCRAACRRAEHPRDLPFPAAISTASTSPWTICRSRTAGLRRAAGRRGADPRRPESTWS